MISLSDYKKIMSMLKAGDEPSEIAALLKISLKTIEKLRSHFQSMGKSS